MTVRVNLGGGNYADLEPDRYEVDRSLLEDGPDEDDGCEGHPAGPFDPMGETVFCDGSCRPRS